MQPCYNGFEMKMNLRTVETIEHFNSYDPFHNKNDYDDLVYVIQMSRSASNYVPQTITVVGIGSSSSPFKNRF